jgi:hypothetical protein
MPPRSSRPSRTRALKAGNNDVDKDGRTFFCDNKDIHQCRRQYSREDVGEGKNGGGHLAIITVLPKPFSAAREQGIVWKDRQVGRLK